MRPLLRSTASDGLASPSPSPSVHASTQSETAAAAGAISVDSDMVVILASLLCALICVAGLALVARCACRRQHPTGVGNFRSSVAPPPPPPKGLKKKAIEALPTVSFGCQPQEDQRGRREEGCAICLAEFAKGEELRVLPHCAHGFHVACIDAWLCAHATCPSCRAAIAYCSWPPSGVAKCGVSSNELHGDDDANAGEDRV